MSELEVTREQSCAVALPRQRNCATDEGASATNNATAAQLRGLKALANAVLERNQQRNRSATTPEKARNFIPQIDPQKLRTIDPMDEARQIAGDEWDTINNLEREALTRLVEIRRMRERGEVPSHYTARTVCAHCGDVPIFEGAPDRVLGCPWCFVKGRKS